MQQKYFWGAAALVVFGAAAAFVAVDYAIHNPTSVLARYGVTAVFSGLNPNPLSDVGKGAALHGGDKDPAVPNDISPNLNNPAEETIEPIQVETLPQPTQEPPLDFGGLNLGGLNVPMDKAPRAMPYADEDLNVPAPGENATGGFGFHGIRGILKIEDVNGPLEDYVPGEWIGDQSVPTDDSKKPANQDPTPSQEEIPHCILGWIEFTLPDANPPKPRGQLQVDVEKMLDCAQELMREARYEEALALLNKIHNLDPQNSAASDGIVFCNKKLKQKCGDCPSIRTESFKPQCNWNWPFCDTMEFRPSDAGRFPLVPNSPF